MALNWTSSRIAPVLPPMGIALALANWIARPGGAWAWTAAIVMFVVMMAVWQLSRIAVRRSSGEAASVRNFAAVNVSIAFGALMMIIPLAVGLAHAYGLVDDPNSGQRASQVVIGAYLVVLGNSMPKMLPAAFLGTSTASSCDGARFQTFQRLAGWTWVLCGLGYATAWLALPITAAGFASMALVVTAMTVMIVCSVRLRKPRQHASGLN